MYFTNETKYLFLDLVIRDFVFSDANSKMAMAKKAMMSMDVRLGNIIGSDIVKVTSGAKNYALNFYLAQANLEKILLADTTAYLLTITKEPALGFGLIAAGAASSLLTFGISGTLPSKHCPKYAWFCACVAEGPDAAYTDFVKTNNCKCQNGLDKISCFPGRKEVNQFSPDDIPRAVCDSFMV
jgi:hypothetical protein